MFEEGEKKKKKKRGEGGEGDGCRVREEKKKTTCRQRTTKVSAEMIVTSILFLSECFETRIRNEIRNFNTE